jgi:signal transduction histidine kinase
MQNLFHGPDRGESRGESTSVVRHAVRRFVLASLLAMLVLALGAVYLSRRIAEDEAIRDARVSAAQIAQNLVAPLLDADLRSGDPSARRRLGALMRHRLQDRSIAHVKVWSPSGRILFSDQHQLVGRRYVLPARVLAIFGTARYEVELPNSEKPVRGGEPDEGDLLEVYVGSRGVDGKPFVFETYTSRSRLAGNTQVIFTEMVPVGLAALLLFSLVTLPLALSLARRVDRGHRHRADLLRHSLSAWAHERRRIAADLHDGVVQDLAAVGYALPVVVSQLPETAGEARATGDHLSRVLVRAITSLRGVVGDLVPSEISEVGLAAALTELAEDMEQHGLEVSVDVPEQVGEAVDVDVARVVYRIVREALRNVVKHSGAGHARVTLRSVDGRVDVRVDDDGRGLGEKATDSDRHFGLDLITETLHEVGGEIALQEREGGGVTLTASLPSELVR